MRRTHRQAAGERSLWLVPPPPEATSPDEAAVSGARSSSVAGAGAAPPPDPATVDGEPDPHDVARQIVLAQLTASPKSRSQLETVLRRRGCAPEVATAVLDRMEEVGLIDDAAYAGQLIRSAQSRRGLSRAGLARELRAKGVDRDVAREALDELDPTAEEELARRLVEKRLRQLHGLDPLVQTRRLAGMLARKGYSGELAMRVIREVLAESPEHRRD